MNHLTILKIKRLIEATLPEEIAEPPEDYLYVGQGKDLPKATGQYAIYIKNHESGWNAVFNSNNAKTCGANDENHYCIHRSNVTTAQLIFKHKVDKGAILTDAKRKRKSQKPERNPNPKEFKDVFVM